MQSKIACDHSREGEHGFLVLGSIVFATAFLEAILTKFQLALTVCNRQIFVTGDSLYQNATSLVKLRNAVVHYKEDWREAGSESTKTGKATARQVSGEPLHGEVQRTGELLFLSVALPFRWLREMGCHVSEVVRRRVLPPHWDRFSLPAMRVPSRETTLTWFYTLVGGSLPSTLAFEHALQHRAGPLLDNPFHPLPY